MGSHDSFIVLRYCRHASKTRPPGNVIHDLVHDTSDSLSFEGLVNQAADKAFSVPKAAQEEVADQLRAGEHAEHQEGRIVVHAFERLLVESMRLKIFQALRCLAFDQFFELAKVS